jgi:hypothetical protein
MQMLAYAHKRTRVYVSVGLDSGIMWHVICQPSNQIYENGVIMGVPTKFTKQNREEDVGLLVQKPVNKFQFYYWSSKNNVFWNVVTAVSIIVFWGFVLCSTISNRRFGEYTVSIFRFWRTDKIRTPEDGESTFSETSFEIMLQGTNAQKTSIIVGFQFCWLLGSCSKTSPGCSSSSYGINLSKPEILWGDV